ncbi:MAG: TolB family protein, partial [Gemmatimonadota bacterium]
MNTSTLRTLAVAFALAHAATIVPPTPALAQTPAGQPLDHDVYEIWMDVEDETISPDGRWVAYALEPEDEGDATLHVRNVDSGEEHTEARGLDPEFDDGSDFVVFRIEPMRDSVRQARLDDVPGDRMPRDSLGILDLATGDVVRIERVESFELPEEGEGVVAYKLHEPLEEPEDSADGGEGEPGAEPGEEGQDDDEEDEKDKPEGTVLVLRDLASGEEHRYEDVTGYAFAEDGERLAYTASNEEGDADGAWVVDVETGEATRVLGGEGVYRRLAWDEDGEQLAFVTNRDDWEAEAPAWAVYRWEAGEADARDVVMAGSDGVPDGWAPSEHGDVEFSESGDRLYFGSAPAPEPEPEDTIPDDEEVVVDVWNWQDDYLQPMQLERREEELNRSWLAVAHLDDGGRIVQLATETVPDVDVGRDGDA